jgi:glutamate racemase
MILVMTLSAPSFAQHMAYKEKDTITVVITDSGLGGLSVLSEVDSAMRSEKCFRNVRLIFCNALAEKNYGYNSMPTREEKAKVFSDALDGMVRWYAPDIILIACNTLSVVYPYTEFAKHPAVPVIGIVDLGVEEIYAKLQNDTQSSVIILGTPTTITANKHKEILIQHGIAPDRIVTQACRNLESEIQENAESETVKGSIRRNLSEALKNMKSEKSSVFVGLCCTHYGYSLDKFETISKELTTKRIEFINPNKAITRVLFEGTRRNGYPSTNVTVSIISRVPVTENEITSLSGLLAKISPASAEAMKNFELKRDLFPFTPTR